MPGAEVHRSRSRSPQQQQQQQATHSKRRDSQQQPRSPQTSPRTLRAGTVPAGLGNFAAFGHTSPEPSALPLPPLMWLTSMMQ